jgi:hypothetical protein
MPVSVFISPISQSAFDGNFSAFLQVLTCDFRKSTPRDNVMPLGALHTFTITIAENLIGRHWKSALHFAFIEAHQIGILPESPNQLDLVSQCIHLFLFLGQTCTRCLGLVVSDTASFSDGRLQFAIAHPFLLQSSATYLCG